MLNRLKYLPILVFFLASNSFCERPPSSKATGFFIGFGVGPRVPIGNFSNSTTLGYGLDVEFSYTDNEYLPVFLFANIGFEQYPGSQQFYQETDYSNFHTNALPVNIGARYYFSPLLENVILLMPVVQLSASYTFYQKLNEFDSESGRDNYVEKNSKLGFSVGAGVSMFMMELLAAYNYNQENQFLSFDLKIRIPLYINF
jgi:hypothetical protein